MTVDTLEEEAHGGCQVALMPATQRVTVKTLSTLPLLMSLPKLDCSSQVLPQFDPLLTPTYQLAYMVLHINWHTW